MSDHWREPGKPGSAYFYDPIPEYGRDQIPVRRLLLPALFEAKLIHSPNREAFLEAGFLFDHAIRCQLNQKIVRSQATLAKEHNSFMASQATHLKPLINQAPRIWIMGYMARAAVVHNFCQEIGWALRGHTDQREANQCQVFYLSMTFLKRKHGNHAITEVVGQFKEFLSVDSRERSKDLLPS